MKNPRLKSINARYTSAHDILEILRIDGAVIISGLLSYVSLAYLKKDLDHYFNDADFCDGLFYGYKTKRIHSLIAKSPTFRDMATNPLVISIMENILGPNCDRIQINLTQGIQIWPGERAQIIHRDDEMFPIRNYNFELMINAIWAYSDFTKDNGATVIVPGSHNVKDRNILPKQEDYAYAEMKEGDLLIYLGSVYHSGGANKSVSPRTGAVISYSLGWLRQFENQYFAAPPELAKKYSKTLQDLLGYAVHKPNLGAYEGNEPSVLFSGKNKRLATSDWLTDDHVNVIARVQEMENRGEKLPDTLDELLKKI